MQRFAIREGWTTFWLVALLVFTATWSVQMADWADGLQILSTITIIGLAVGLVLAQVRRIPSIVAHLAALLLGTVVVLYEMTNFLSDSIGGRRAKLDYLWTRWTHWYHLVSHGQRADDLYLFILLMAALLWVLSYISVWFVFRSHWIWLTLLLPGVILLLNMGYSERVPHVMIVLYLFAAILLLMRYTFAEREISWKRIGIPYPEALPWRGFWVASYLAMAVILVGWLTPITSTSQLMLSGWQQVNGPWRNLEDNFNNWFASLRGPGTVGIGGFASFGNKFQLGGPLHLSDQPVLLVKTNGNAPYVEAHTYNIFNGLGWESNLDQNSDTTSSSVPPVQRFGANDQIPVPPSASKDRKQQTYSMKVLTPRNSVIFSAGETTSVSVPTSVQVSFYDYANQSLDVLQATKADTPPLLWPLVSALQGAQLQQPGEGALPPQVGQRNEIHSTPTSRAIPTASPGATPQPTATPIDPNSIITIAGKSWVGDPDVVKEIKDALDGLGQDGVSVDLTVSPVGKTNQVTKLTFSGSLPVYSDIEAIYASSGVQSGESYNVTSLMANATSAQLQQAGTNYPQEITQRYMGVPPHSQRTDQLAHQITANFTNPFDKATAIEMWLRQNMKYDENVPNPPSNSNDLVDYFLFNLKRGYCTYYSSAMNEMLRLLGIPSREVVGFYPADYDSASGGYLYRDRNAHAWVEVYFPGYGWVPFEPTAARSVFQYGPTPTKTTPAAATSNNNPAGAPPQDNLNRFLDPGQQVGGGPVGTIKAVHHTTTLDWVLRGVIALILLVIAVVAFLWLRGMRGMSPATRLFTKVQRGAGWGGLPTKPSMTPYEYASTVSRHIPGARTHVNFLAALYVRERYGRHPATATDLSRARAAWLRVRVLLLRFLFLQRWRASGQIRYVEHDLGADYD